ncbi:MAG: stage 0 sporulation protein [Firmicutes bacterium]|nr:stage 0 sporulation protein [Bacillota bacterium]
MKTKKIVGIRFPYSPKVYSFAAGDFEYTLGQGVVVETVKGIEYGTVKLLPYEVEAKDAPKDLKPVIRLATEEDENTRLHHAGKHQETLAAAREMIGASNLPMKVVDVEFTLDSQKLVIYFTAENRVDFRELVRQLASRFRTRIELRQIGSRDEVRHIGGLGSCGRPCCCNSCMPEYPKASLKMAKNQGLSLTPAKISGMCGRLMCCLEYENKHYAEINKRMPRVGSTVKTKEGKEGIVIQLHHLKERVKLKLPEKDQSYSFGDFALNEVIFRANPKHDNNDRDDDIPEELRGLE